MAVLLSIREVSPGEDTLKRKVLCCILLLVFIMTGCFDQRNVEDVSLTLILGLDLDRNDNLLVYIKPCFQ